LYQLNQDAEMNLKDLKDWPPLADTGHWQAAERPS